MEFTSALLPLNRGICSQGLEDSFSYEGSSSTGISSGEKMLHLKTSPFPWSLASDMAENHNSIESTLGTDRPQSAAPVHCWAAGAGRDEHEDAWEHGIPTAAWLLEPLCLGTASLHPGDASWQPGVC